MRSSMLNSSGFKTLFLNCALKMSLSLTNSHKAMQYSLIKYKLVVNPLRSVCKEAPLTLLGFLSIIEAYNDFYLT